MSVPSNFEQAFFDAACGRAPNICCLRDADVYNYIQWMFHHLTHAQRQIIITRVCGCAVQAVEPAASPVGYIPEAPIPVIPVDTTAPTEFCTYPPPMPPPDHVNMTTPIDYGKEAGL
jgi:hypothetical protein